jgi:hypothetical protein
MSLRQTHISTTTLTLIYQEKPAGETHYASVPVSSNYQVRLRHTTIQLYRLNFTLQEVLDDACQCFEEYLPDNVGAYKLELKHKIGEGRWATIHPRVFTDLVDNAQEGEFMLSIRPARNLGSNGPNNNGKGLHHLVSYQSYWRTLGCQ